MAWAYFKYWVWQMVTKPSLGVIYLSVISDGLRYLVPPLAQRLYKLPGLSVLQDYEETYRLDLAPFFAFFLLIAVWYLWEKLLQLWLGWDEALDGSEWNLEAYRRLISTLGVAIVGADACLFYVAMTQVGWRGMHFSFSALVATAAYVGVLIFVSLVTVNLRRALKNS